MPPPSSKSVSPEFNYFNYQASYLKNSRAIGVLWCVFSMCYAIINIVVFLQPQWLGDTEVSKGTGYFGLWKHCRLLQDGQDLICKGRLDDFNSILSPSFKASTILIGLSVLIITLCICSFILFFFLHSSTVFHICGWFQAFNGLFLLMGILIFPTGWDSSQIKEVCGQTAMYNPGDCQVRWSFILAIIAVVDVFVLCILAFVLGSRYVKMLPDQYLPSNTSIYKGEINNGYLADNLSRKSMTLQPVQMLMDAEKYSDYSVKGSVKGGRVAASATTNGGFHPSNYSVNNFQL